MPVFKMALIMLHSKFEPSIPFWSEDIEIFVSNLVKISQNGLYICMVSVLPIWSKLLFQTLYFYLNMIELHCFRAKKKFIWLSCSGALSSNGIPDNRPTYEAWER